MANTVIQLKWSEITSTPSSLNVAEPAYSNTSGKLFIGQAGNQVIAIGGSYYTGLIDSATDANTSSAIVKRDSSGIFSATAVRASLYGNANTATALQTARNFEINGVDVESAAVSFDGSAGVTLQGNLKTTGVSAGTYGGSANIPVFVVDTKGRITSASNVSVSVPTTLNVKADTGDNAISLQSDTLTFVGGDGITTSVDPTDNVKFDVDNTVIRTTGNQTITGNLSITGNLIIVGNTVTANVSTLVIDDPLIQLAANNEISDSVDIGFYGHYSDDGGTTKRHTGLFRDTSTADKRYILFTNLEDATLDIGSATTVNVAQSSFAVANLQTNIIGGKVSGLTQAIAVADGGTGATSFTTGNIVAYNGTTLVSLANTGTAGTYANASHVPVITTDEYGRVSGITNTAIAIDAAAITTGTLPIARGGTNQTTFTTGNVVIFDGTSLASLANSTYTLTGGLASGNTISSLTVDGYGRVTAATGELIAIAASQITSGTLATARGGTGLSSFTANSILYASSSSVIGQLSSSTEGHVLQINNSGAPVFAHLNGGSF